MDWNVILHAVNTTDTVLGLLFLATSWAVWKRRA